jgi:hypothetical protein
MAEQQQPTQDDVEFMTAEQAADDDTVDDQEFMLRPWRPDQLPEGARTADYDPNFADDYDEAEDGTEETPPPTKDQARG